MRESNRVCPLLPTLDPSAVWEHGEEFSWARCCLHPASSNPLPRAALLLPSSWPGIFLSTKASHPWDRGSPQAPWHMSLTALHSRDPTSYSGPLPTLLPPHFSFTSPNVFIAFFSFYFLLKDNCFTEFCCFLSNLNMNQPCLLAR